MENQFQHLIQIQCNELLKPLQKLEWFFLENLATGKHIQWT